MCANNTSELDDLCHRSKTAVDWIWRIIAPIMFVMGMLNTMAVVAVFRYPRFLGSSMAFHLFLLAIFDSVVMCTGLVGKWIVHAFNVNVRNISDIGCKLHVFVLSVSFDMCSWILTSVTVERALVVIKPLEMLGRFTARRTALRLFSIFVVFSGTSMHFLFTMGLQPAEGGMVCTSLSEEYLFFHEHIFLWIDMGLHSFIPFCVMAVSNWLMHRSLLKQPDFNQWTDTVSNKTMKDDVVEDIDFRPPLQDISRKQSLPKEGHDIEICFPGIVSPSDLHRTNSMSDVTDDFEPTNESYETNSSVSKDHQDAFLPIHDKTSTTDVITEHTDATDSQNSQLLFIATPTKHSSNTKIINTPNVQLATTEVHIPSPLEILPQKSKPTVLNGTSERHYNKNRNAKSKKSIFSSSQKSSSLSTFRSRSSLHHASEIASSADSMVLLATFLFFIMIAPMDIFTIVGKFIDDIDSECTRSNAALRIVRALFTLLVHATYTVNVYLYGARNKSFRRELILTLKCYSER